MVNNAFLSAVVSALLLVGCTGSAHVRGSASVSAPRLILIQPGVQVVADHREPIFYADGYYWRSSGNVWYRSSFHTRGWVRYQAPSAVLRIERPSAYVYYRGSARATTRPAQGNGPAYTPAMTRDERKDVKEAQKEERKEMKEAQKEERKDMRDAQKDARKNGK